MIYFIEAVGSGRVKVGYAVNSKRRLGEHQISCPLPLRLIGEIDGSPSDERLAHRALGKDGRGEWFDKAEAMKLLRVMRRFGAGAARHFVRWRLNERRSFQSRSAFSHKATALVSRNIARTTLSTIPSSRLTAVTGMAEKSWRRAATGQTMPSGHHFLNSLLWAPNHFANLVWALTRQRLVPLQADRIRGTRP